jgi:hypothetical protein
MSTPAVTRATPVGPKTKFEATAYQNKTGGDTFYKVVPVPYFEKQKMATLQY